MRDMSNVLGSGILKQPKIRIARRKGLLCNPCYNEKMVAITGNSDTHEPLTSDLGGDSLDLKEKAIQLTKWKVYGQRRRKRAFYKETAKNLGLLENPKEVIFWEGDDNSGKWVSGEQLCNEGMIGVYKGRGKGSVEKVYQGIIVRITVKTREWNQEKDILPVESSRIKLDDGMFTVFVGKCGHPAKRLTGKVIFPNSSEPKVRISWFGKREEWQAISQVAFGEEVTAIERNKKAPERLTWDPQQQTKVRDNLRESAEAKKKEKKNRIYLEELYELIDFDDVTKVAVLGTDGTEVHDIERRRISTLVAKGEYSDAYRRMCTKKDDMDRRELLRKEAEKAMKKDGIERPHNNAKKHKEEDETHKRIVGEYEHIRGEYEERLADTIRIDREFVDHDMNHTLIELSAIFDMVRRNIPTFVLPDLAVNINDTIASINECFYDKYDNKLCVDCNKNKRKFKGGLCKGCYIKHGNEIITKKCVDCNTNQAKCKGGLCKGCHKKQGSDRMK